MTPSLPDCVTINPQGTLFATTADLDLMGAEGERVATYLLNSKTLNEITFTNANTFGQERSEVFTKLLSASTTLQKLVLHNSDFNPQEIAPFCEALKTNQTVEHLDLSGHAQLGDTLAIHLATALRVNTTLKSLFLSYSGITDKGAEDLLQAIASQTCLLSVLDVGNDVTDSLKSQLQTQLALNRQKTLSPLVPTPLTPAQAAPPSTTSSAQSTARYAAHSLSIRQRPIHNDDFSNTVADRRVAEDQTRRTPENAERVVETGIQMIDSFPSSGGTHREIIPEQQLLISLVAIRSLMAITAAIALTDFYIFFNTHSFSHLSAAFLFGSTCLVLSELTPIIMTALKANHHALSKEKMPQLIANLTQQLYSDARRFNTLKISYASVLDVTTTWAHEHSQLITLYQKLFPNKGAKVVVTLRPFTTTYELDHPIQNGKL